PRGLPRPGRGARRHARRPQSPRGRGRLPPDSAAGAESMTRVLVIDDEPQIRRALRVGLERSGFTVHTAGGGEEGLDEAGLHPPDVVILDLAMPATDGIAVCRRLREWSQVPIIVLSVREGERDKIEALNLGADDYLTKPFSLEELVARIRAVLRRTGS